MLRSRLASLVKYNNNKTHVVRHASTQSASSVSVEARPAAVRHVLISQYADLNSNLALEEWLYRNHDLQHKSVLLLWRTAPSVLIALNSGGSRSHVYHDLGSLTCSFLGSGSSHTGVSCQQLVTTALQRLTQRTVVADKNAITIEGRKNEDSFLVAGSQCHLHEDNPTALFEPRWCESVRLCLRKLTQADPVLNNVDKLQEALGWQFLTDNNSKNNNNNIRSTATFGTHRGFTLVRPDEGWFPGISRIKEDLGGPQRLLGGTQSVKVRRSFPLPMHLSNGDKSSSVLIELGVSKGVAQDVRVMLPLGMLQPHVDLSEPALNTDDGGAAGRLRDDGKAKLRDAVGSLLSHRDVPTEKSRFILNCVQAMIAKIA